MLWIILKTVKASPLFVVCLVFLAATGFLCAQSDNPSSQPGVTLENKPKPPKESNARTIEGTVTDAADNPAENAIVQLKDTKTSQVVDYATKENGKFVFRDLYMDVNYELFAKRGDITTPVKKVSIYDTRKDVVLNFRLEPDKK